MDVADPIDRRLALRALAVLYGGGGLLALVWVAAGGPDAGSQRGVAALAVAALLGSGLLALTPPRRAGERLLGAALAAGTMLLTAGLLAADAAGSRFAFVLLWAMPYAFAFFSRAHALGQTVLLALAYAAATTASQGPVENALRWAFAVGLLAVVGDLVQRHARRLTREQRFSRMLMERFPAGVVRVDAGLCVAEANPAFDAMLGLAPHSAHGRDLAAFLADAEREPFCRRLQGVLEGAPGFQQEVHLRAEGRRPVPMLAAVSGMEDQQGRPAALVVLQDVTERKRAEDELRHLAHHDELTGLPNRRRFGEALQDHLVRAERYGAEGALLLIDLDGFKQVNDRLGHAVGDRVLEHAAGVLHGRLRRSDLLARYGGDEFAVLLPRAEAGEAVALAEELVAALEGSPLRVGGDDLVVGASIGVAPLDREATTPARAVALADRAMYAAKASPDRRVASC
jgi:diguanylate cyclase (GGDEF)-like protein/PAS domain S-box-containing protein